MNQLSKEEWKKINNDSFTYYLKEYRKFSNLQIKICCMFNSWKLKKLNG